MLTVFPRRTQINDNSVSFELMFQVIEHKLLPEAGVAAVYQPESCVDL